MASKTIRDSETKIHIQKIFDMNGDEFTCFEIKNLLSFDIYGQETFLAFNWTNIIDRNDNHPFNKDLFYGTPIIMIKVYMAAQLWL